MSIARFLLHLDTFDSAVTISEHFHHLHGCVEGVVKGTDDLDCLFCRVDGRSDFADIALQLAACLFEPLHYVCCLAQPLVHGLADEDVDLSAEPGVFPPDLFGFLFSVRERSSISRSCPLR